MLRLYLLPSANHVERPPKERPLTTLSNLTRRSAWVVSAIHLSHLAEEDPVTKMCSKAQIQREPRGHRPPVSVGTELGPDHAGNWLLLPSLWAAATAPPGLQGTEGANRPMGCQLCFLIVLMHVFCPLHCCRSHQALQPWPELRRHYSATPPIYFRQCVSLIFRKRGSDQEVRVRYHFLSPALCVCMHSRAVHPGACGGQMLMCLVSFFYHFPYFLFKLHFYGFFGVCGEGVHECMCTAMFTWRSEDNLPIYVFDMGFPTERRTGCLLARLTGQWTQGILLSPSTPFLALGLQTHACTKDI